MKSHERHCVSYYRQSDCWAACWSLYLTSLCCNYSDSKVHGANMGSIWGRQDPDGPHVGPTNLAIRVKKHQGTQQPYRISTWRIRTSCVTLRFSLLKSRTVSLQPALIDSLIKQCNWNLMGTYFGNLLWSSDTISGSRTISSSLHVMNL